MAGSSTPGLPVLIIGGGVAGLALAQGLRLRSIPFRLFERYPQSHSSQGHRFHISKEGHDALLSVLSADLRDLLRRTAPDGSPFTPRYVDARKLEFPEPTPAGADTLAVDRPWIRLLTSLDIEDAIEYEKEFESYEVVDDQVLARFTDGSLVHGRLLVGADGIRSRVRAQLQPDRKLLDLERWLLWARTPLTESLNSVIPADLLTWCMYADREANVQVVAEPVMWSKSVARDSEHRLPDFTSYVYWVICTAPYQFAETLPKTVAEKKLFLERATEGWHPALRLLLQSANHEQSACVPVLSSKPDIELRSTEQTGRVTLLGDAAHVMSPMGGAGGDTAIRNAADLARTIGENGISSTSIAEFEASMEALAKEKIEHSFMNGQKFWRGKAWTEYR